MGARLDSLGHPARSALCFESFRPTPPHETNANLRTPASWAMLGWNPMDRMACGAEGCGCGCLEGVSDEQWCELPRRARRQ
jgi:hypothetical protein